MDIKYPELYAFLDNSNILPDLRNKTLMGANDDNTIGNTSNVRDIQNAQLPNIVGHYQTHLGGIAKNTATGAFISSGESNRTLEYSDYNQNNMMDFSASNNGASTDHLGNNVYTSNGEVRSANIRVNWLIKVL